jgi:transcriptional regulator with XRE-family HTH domain
MNEHRSVPLDVLREWARDEAERTSLRSLASRVGMGRTTLAKFIAGATTPHPRVRRAVALAYLAGRPDPLVDALAWILGGLPDEAQSNARLRLLDAVADVYRSAGAKPPPWTGRI